MALDKKLTLKVNGMHCGGCANKIKKSIDELGIEQTTDVDVSGGEVVVKFDSAQAGVSDIKSKITAVGFQVEGISLE